MPVRQIKAGYSNTTSSFHSLKLNRAVKAESSLETDFLFLLDNDHNVDWFEEQPLEIAYTSPSGRKVTYTPDTLVRYKNIQSEENYVLYEVKFRSDLSKNWNKLKPKFKAALTVCKQRGWRFKIMTEKEIRNVRLKNLEFLHHFSRSISPMESEIRSTIYKLIKGDSYTTPKETLARLFSNKMQQAEAIPVLWRMVQDGTITMDLNAPINMHANMYIDQEYR